MIHICIWLTLAWLICAPQTVTKIGRNVFTLLDAVSQSWFALSNGKISWNFIKSVIPGTMYVRGIFGVPGGHLLERHAW